MKTVWEASDFSGYNSVHGTIVNMNGPYLVGYLNGNGQNIALISLNDGLIIEVATTATEAADYFNRGNVTPCIAFKKFVP